MHRRRGGDQAAMKIGTVLKIVGGLFWFIGFPTLFADPGLASIILLIGAVLLLLGFAVPARHLR
jgi:membrane-bound ClpP family serine protease